MNDSNQRTLQSYEDHIKEYIEGTPQEVSGVIKEWIDAALADLPKTARILEIGSAFGRDAMYLQSLGYAVQTTDATQAFVDLLREKGFDAKLLNVISDPIDGTYNLVLANAVFLHFMPTELASVLDKIFAALNDGGRLAFTVKQGDGEKWTDAKLGADRYFCYWQPDALRKLVENAGFTIRKISSNQKTTRDVWVQVIAEK